MEENGQKHNRKSHTNAACFQLTPVTINTTFQIRGFFYVISFVALIFNISIKYEFLIFGFSSSIGKAWWITTWSRYHQNNQYKLMSTKGVIPISADDVIIRTGTYLIAKTAGKGCRRMELYINV